jgi:hypothetical protein
MNKNYLQFATEAEKQALLFEHPGIKAIQEEIRDILRRRYDEDLALRTDARVSEVLCRHIQLRMEGIEEPAPVEEDFTDFDLLAEIERLTRPRPPSPRD